MNAQSSTRPALCSLMFINDCQSTFRRHEDSVIDGLIFESEGYSRVSYFSEHKRSLFKTVHLLWSVLMGVPMETYPSM